MKLENCGRCGLEPSVYPLEELRIGHDPWAECPACQGDKDRIYLGDWNAAQFAARTERVNAAAVEICTGQKANDSFEGDVLDAEELIAMQDERARVRWAEMQKGE
jgi:hypothetical protein